MSTLFDFDRPDHWTGVQGSTNIAAIQYTAGDPAADFGTLRVRFTSGAEYSYDKVPNQLAVDFFESESKGKFFHANIKSQFEGVRNISNELQDDLEKRAAEQEETGSYQSPEDIPISELFDSEHELPALANEVKIDEPVPKASVYAPDEPILPQTYRERA